MYNSGIAPARVLAIDTSLQACSVAYFDVARGIPDGLFSHSLPLAHGHAEHLMPLIEGVLADAEASYQHIEAIICVNGPGSFTGLRVGLSAARGLALALTVPLYGITSLQALALQYAAGQSGSIAVCIDTRRDDYYLQVYDASGNPANDPAALTALEAEACLGGFRGFSMIGDAATALAEKMPALQPYLANPPCSSIDIAFLAQVFQQRIWDEQVCVLNPEPVYLRPADVTMAKSKAI